MRENSMWTYTQPITAPLAPQMATICEKCVVGVEVEDGGGASGECSTPTRAVGACRALTTGVCVVRILRRVQERAQQYVVRMHSERRQRCSQELNTSKGIEAGGAGISGTGGDIGASGAGGALMTAVRAVRVLEQTQK
jgi:hypothetical protein